MNRYATESLAFSIAEFCGAYGISRATFYDLRKMGRAPATLKIGRRRLITKAAAEVWEKAMTSASA